MKKLALALLFFCADALAIPTEINAEYQLTNLGVVIGRINESFVRKGDSYEIHSVTRSEGLLKLLVDDQITLESTGRVVPTGLQPLQFEQRRAKQPDRTVNATFDWERGTMHSFSGGKQKEVPLPRETQDRISIMYQFMNMDGHPKTVVMPMSNGRKVEYYTYRFVEEVRLQTPAGPFDTLHYARVTEDAKETRAEVWLAKDHFNFPVRVVIDEPKGLRLEQLLVALRSR